MSEAQPSPAGKARVFFALWPDASIQDHLLLHGRQLHAQLGGKLTRQESIHLTLAFLGYVTLERLAVARNTAASVQFERFSLSVDRAGCFRQSGIGWVAPAAVPKALLIFADDLQSGLRNAGFTLEDRPYSPHITLLRKARCKVLDMRLEPVEWDVRDFVLVQSQPSAAGSRYTVIDRWPARF